MKKQTIIRTIKVILIGIVGALFFMSAYGKLSGASTAVSVFDTLHLAAFRTALGVVEVIIVLSLIWRQTRNIGVLIGTAYLGGAMAAEFMLGLNGLIPGLMILTLWIIQKLNWLNMRHGAGCGCGICTNCTDCSNGICKLHSDQKTCDCADGECTHH